MKGCLPGKMWTLVKVKNLDAKIIDRREKSVRTDF